jgi:hypothetical protein
MLKPSSGYKSGVNSYNQEKMQLDVQQKKIKGMLLL